MSRWLEFEEKNVEKAVKKASDELNIPREKLKHDVISYGSSGIFGLVGTKKARIRVFLPEGENGNLKASLTAISESAEEKADIGSEIILETPKEVPAVQKESLEASRDAFDAEASLFKEKETETEMKETVPPLIDPVEVGRTMLQKIVDCMTTGALITVEKKPDRIFFYIKGGNTGVLIGKRGQTLEAIQYLIDKIVNKQSDVRVRIHIDVEGYLASRKSNLKRLAERLAQRSKRTGKPMTIGQMNSHDRRIVHLALKDDNAVRTQSLGDGSYRKLVIFPKKVTSRKEK